MMLTLLRKLIPFLPYIIIAGVVLGFWYSYSDLKSTNQELRTSLDDTKQQLETIENDYVRQQEISTLRDTLNTQLQEFAQERQERTIKFIQQTEEINNEDGSNTLNNDVKRLLSDELKGRGYK